MEINCRNGISIVYLLFILTEIFGTLVDSHVCMLQGRYNPSSKALQWSLPRKELCLCQAIVAPNKRSVQSCPREQNTEDTDNLWFSDNPAPFTDRRNWRQEKLDVLLDRSFCYIDECRLNPCLHGATCHDRIGNYICQCLRGFEGVNCQHDVEAPIISCQEDSQYPTDPGQSTAVVLLAEPTVSDNSGKSSVTCSADSGRQFEIGHTLVTCQASDLSDNNATCSFMIHVKDNEKPSIIGMPANITTSSLNHTSIDVNWTEPTASDNCGAQTLTSSHIPGSMFHVGSTPVTYTSTDPSGNVENKIFFVIVEEATTTVQTTAVTTRGTTVQEIAKTTVKTSTAATAKEVETTTTTISTPKPTDCDMSLGLEDGRIQDRQITASSLASSNKLDCCNTSLVRLNSNGRWRPRNDDPYKWIRIDLVDNYTVSGIFVQRGAGAGDNSNVKACKVKYWYAEVAGSGSLQDSLAYVTNADGNVQIFEVNNDDGTPEIIMFDKPVYTSIIQVEPFTCETNFCAMRLEIIGC